MVDTFNYPYKEAHVNSISTTLLSMKLLQVKNKGVMSGLTKNELVLDFEKTKLIKMQ